MSSSRMLFDFTGVIEKLTKNENLIAPTSSNNSEDNESLEMNLSNSIETNSNDCNSRDYLSDSSIDFNLSKSSSNMIPNVTNVIDEILKTYNKPIIISIEGNIGSGKSTLVSQLEKKYGNNPDFYFLQEPVDIWNTIVDENGVTILEKFYGNTEKYAFQFQVMAYISRLTLLRKALKVQCKYIITERSIFTDAHIFAKMLYDDKKMSQIEYSIYKMWFDEFIDESPVSKLIYVKANPEISCNRVIKRKRQGENIPLEYLSKCHEYHEDWLSREKNILTLDGNQDIYETPEVIHEWINQIHEFIVQK
jgi:deoxyadenosine/deoxycytidine kinase